MTRPNITCRRHVAVLIALGGLLGSGLALAETRYVSDHLVITLRTGKGNQYQILRSLPSGTALDILEEDGEFARVRLTAGLEGWVRTQYLVNEPVAREKLAAAEKRLTAVEAKNRDLQQQLRELQMEKASITKARAELEGQHERLSNQHAELRALAAEPMRVNAENQVMRERIVALEQEIEDLKDYDDALRNEAYRSWFVTGAGVLAVGIVLGLLLPRLRRRQKSAWREL